MMIHSSPTSTDDGGRWKRFSETYERPILDASAAASPFEKLAVGMTNTRQSCLWDNGDSPHAEASGHRPQLSPTLRSGPLPTLKKKPGYARLLLTFD